ncbi:MAG: hypothetical protein ACRDVE_12940, partial [Actinocrinis sp.]
TVITFINPAVAVVLGMLVLNERFTAGVAVGFPLVLLGSWLSTRKGRRDSVGGVDEAALDAVPAPAAAAGIGGTTMVAMGD